MFDAAADRITDCRNHLFAAENASDFPSFRSSIDAFINSARSVTLSLQKEGAPVAGFEEWYQDKQTEMRNDQLLLFVNSARIDYFHQAGERLRAIGAHLDYFSTKDAEPPPPNASGMVIGAQGPMWVVGKGTPQERLVPVKSGGTWTIAATFDDPPRSHRGQEIPNPNPINICRLALTYFEELVYEARSRFANAGDQPHP